MQTAHPKIPHLKIAKVGKNRERKGGGIPLWFGRGARAGFSGATGGAGLGAKLGVALLVAALGAGAYSVGVSLREDESRFLAQKTPRAFASAQADKLKYQGDLTKLPATPKSSGDSVGMSWGSLDGKTPEQRAAEQAATDAAAKAAQEKAAKEAAAPPEQPTLPGLPAGANPADVAAAAAGAVGAAGAPSAEQGKKGGNFSTRIGALTSGSGGGSSPLAGGSGLSGGISRAFDHIKSDMSRLTGFGGSRKIPATPGRASSAPPGGRRAFDQLKRASLYSNRARTGAAESSAGDARAAFESNPGGGTAIGGAGSGTGAPSGGGSPDANPPAVPGGGPTAGGEGGEGTSEPRSAPAVNKTPWQGMVDLAKMLLMIAGIILMVGMLLSMLAKKLAGTPAALVLWRICQALGWTVVAMAGIATLMGIMILGMGQMMQGLMFTIMGAFTTYGGYKLATLAGEGAAAEKKAAEEAAKNTAKPVTEQIGKGKLQPGSESGYANSGTGSRGSGTDFGSKSVHTGNPPGETGTTNVSNADVASAPPKDGTIGTRTTIEPDGSMVTEKVIYKEPSWFQKLFHVKGGYVTPHDYYYRPDVY